MRIAQKQHARTRCEPSAIATIAKARSAPAQAMAKEAASRRRKLT